MSKSTPKDIIINPLAHFGNMHSYFLMLQWHLSAGHVGRFMDDAIIMVGKLWDEQFADGHVN